MVDRLWTQPLSPQDLGRFLAGLRQERGWTQDDLAELLGISRRYIYEIESGKPNLYTNRLFSLLRVLGARLTVEAAPGPGTLPLHREVTADRPAGSAR